MNTDEEFSRDLEGDMNLLLIVSISVDALKISGSSSGPLHDNFRDPGATRTLGSHMWNLDLCGEGPFDRHKNEPGNHKR